MTAVHGGRLSCARSPSLLLVGAVFTVSRFLWWLPEYLVWVSFHIWGGRGLQVVSDMYYGFTSSSSTSLLSSEQCGFHHKQAIPSSFILVGAFLCSFLLHMIRNFRNKNKKVAGLVCYEVSTLPMLCWITERHLAGFLLICLSRTPIGLFVLWS